MYFKFIKKTIPNYTTETINVAFFNLARFVLDFIFALAVNFSGRLTCKKRAIISRTESCNIQTPNVYSYLAHSMDSVRAGLSGEVCKLVMGRRSELMNRMAIR
jgi:hypothetical protein